MELVGSFPYDISCREEGHSFQSWQVTHTVSPRACKLGALGGVKNLSQEEPEPALGGLSPFVLQANAVWGSSLGLLLLQRADLGR